MEEVIKSFRLSELTIQQIKIVQKNELLSIAMKSINTCKLCGYKHEYGQHLSYGKRVENVKRKITL